MTLLKEKITFGTIMGVVREYFVMTIGILLYTFAWIACILPAHGTGGGATGAALVLCGAIENLFNFQINIGTMAFIVNGILLLFAGFIIGWNFGIKTIFCIIVLPASLNFFQETLPGVQAWLAELGVIPPDAISLFGNLEPLLLVIMGGMLSGVGIYMCFSSGRFDRRYGYRGAADQQVSSDQLRPCRAGDRFAYHLCIAAGGQRHRDGDLRLPADGGIRSEHRCVAGGQPAVESDSGHQP